jgi:hypothetical protein
MAKKEAKPKRINRSAAANAVVAELNGKAALSELAAKADAMFVEHGGESNVKAAAHYLLRVLETAETLGSVKLTRPTDITVERIKAK